MDKLLIEGNGPLSGEIRVSGAKNAALPILCAALLTPEPLVLHNVPNLQDVRTMLKLLRQMGVEGTLDGHEVTLNAAVIHSPEASYDLVKTMRASILCWARCWRASAMRVCRCRAAAASARVRSISTSRACS